MSLELSSMVMSVNPQSPYNRLAWKRQTSLKASTEFAEGESLFDIAETALDGRQQNLPLARVAIEVVSLYDLDNLNRDMSVDVCVHLVWTDRALVGVSLSRRYDPASVGSVLSPPYLELHNDDLARKETSFTVSYPDILQSSSTGLVHQVSRLSGRFRLSSEDISNFPLDSSRTLIRIRPSQESGNFQYVN